MLVRLEVAASGGGGRTNERGEGDRRDGKEGTMDNERNTHEFNKIQ